MPLLLSLLLLPACDCSGPITPEAPDARGTLVIAANSDYEHLLSVVSEKATDGDIMENIFFPVIDTDFDCSLKKGPALATEWAWNEDGTQLSMTLRDDITFADGVQLTARDVAFTYALLADPTVGSPYVGYVEHMTPDGRPEVVDDTHIVWHFTHAYDRDTQIAHTASIPILPRHLLAHADRTALRSHELDENPVGSGPFALVTHEPNSRIVLEPNPAFTGPAHFKPKLDRVVFRILPDAQIRLLELQDGKVDLVTQVPIRDADMLREKHPEINLMRREFRSMDYVGWNLDDPLFQDVRVRTGLAHAADVDAIIATLLTGSDGTAYAQRAVGTVTPALCGMHNSDIVPLAHDLAKAQALFADAGWSDTDGDGVLDKDGEPFRFTITTNSSNKRRTDAVVLLQSQWKKAGVVVDIEKQDTAAFHANQNAGEFQAALGGWAASLFTDPSMLWHCKTEERPYEFNFINYCEEDADALIEAAMATPELRESAPIMKELQSVIYEDQPYLFLYWLDEIVAVHGRFENTSVDLISPINDLHEWSVPPDKVKYSQ